MITSFVYPYLSRFGYYSQDVVHKAQQQIGIRQGAELNLLLRHPCNGIVIAHPNSLYIYKFYDTNNIYNVVLIYAYMA